MLTDSLYMRSTSQKKNDSSQIKDSVNTFYVSAILFIIQMPNINTNVLVDILYDITYNFINYPYCVLNDCTLWWCLPLYNRVTISIVISCLHWTISIDFYLFLMWFSQKNFWVNIKFLKSF